MFFAEFLLSDGKLNSQRERSTFVGFLFSCLVLLGFLRRNGFHLIFFLFVCLLNILSELQIFVKRTDFFLYAQYRFVPFFVLFCFVIILILTSISRALCVQLNVAKLNYNCYSSFVFCSFLALIFALFVCSFLNCFVGL